MAALAQAHHRDPLTEGEIDKIRDSAQIPEVRLKLYMEFARARLEKIQKIHSDTKGNRPRKADSRCASGFSGRL